MSRRARRRRRVAGDMRSANVEHATSATVERVRRSARERAMLPETARSIDVRAASAGVAGDGVLSSTLPRAASRAGSGNRACAGGCSGNRAHAERTRGRPRDPSGSRRSFVGGQPSPERRHARGARIVRQHRTGRTPSAVCETRGRPRGAHIAPRPARRGGDSSASALRALFGRPKRVFGRLKTSSKRPVRRGGNSSTDAFDADPDAIDLASPSSGNRSSARIPDARAQVRLCRICPRRSRNAPSELRASGNRSTEADRTGNCAVRRWARTDSRLGRPSVEVCTRQTHHSPQTGDETVNTTNSSDAASGRGERGAQTRVAGNRVARAWTRRTGGAGHREAGVVAKTNSSRGQPGGESVRHKLDRVAQPCGESVVGRAGRSGNRAARSPEIESSFGQPEDGSVVRTIHRADIEHA
jgi:hypothetical protein